MLTGDFAALATFYGRLRKFSEASRKIAQAVSPKVEGLVNEGFAGQHGPNGEVWPPTKSGAPAFGGGDSGGRVLSRLVGKSSVRTTVLWPLHFHQDGTHRIGRKRGRAIAAKIMGGYAKAVLRQHGLTGAGPRKRKGESDAAFAARVERFAKAKQMRQEARGSAKKHAAAAVEEARAAGGWHDPPRPMIPDENDAIPPTWIEVIGDAARPVLEEIGATQR